MSMASVNFSQVRAAAEDVMNHVAKNPVSAALLDLKDRNAVVKVQVGTAVPLLFCNIALIYFLGFR